MGRRVFSGKRQHQLKNFRCISAGRNLAFAGGPSLVSIAAHQNFPHRVHFVHHWRFFLISIATFPRSAWRFSFFRKYSPCCFFLLSFFFRNCGRRGFPPGGVLDGDHGGVHHGAARPPGEYGRALGLRDLHNLLHHVRQGDHVPAHLPAAGEHDQDADARPEGKWKKDTRGAPWNTKRAGGLVVRVFFPSLPIDTPPHALTCAYPSIDGDS